MKILAMKLRRLGDTILWTSALTALTQLPEAEVDIAFPKAYAELFESDPRFRRRFPLEERFFENRMSIREWRAENYDVAVGFHASSRSLALILSAGANQKVIHHHSRTARRYHSDLAIPNLGVPMPAHERDINAVRALGWAGLSPLPHIYLSDEARKQALEVLNANRRNLSQKLIVLSVGASRPAKRWPLSKYVELARQLKPLGEVALVYDSENTFGEAHFLRRALKREALFFFTPTLTSLMGVLSFAGLYVGGDSGVKHLAAALGVPTVTLFGPESEGEWQIYPPERHKTVRVSNLLCRSNDPTPEKYAWCGVESCPLSSHACMSLISVADVVTQVQKLLF